MPIVLEIAKRLATGGTTSEALVEEALARADDRAGEGARVFTKLYRAQSRAAARASDRARSFGVVASPLAGLPISIKDLFDVQGEPTPAGSRVLADAAPALRDAPVVARLRAAGAVIIGRTSMTEFAFSGLGINPHYGTPLNPFDRATGRIPGGSSSGAAVAVSDAMSVVGIGTDTGGSVRIPAALCGLVGFKPTAARVPREGVLPLSSTLDSIGPIAASVACCALVDAVIAGAAPVVPLPLPVGGLRLGVVRDYVCDGLDHPVSVAFERALDTLARAGARLNDVPLPELARLPQINRSGGLAGAEAFAWHRDLLARCAGQYDPRVSIRIRAAQNMSAADYIELIRQRADMIQSTRRSAAPFDALLMPTVAIVAPALAPLVERDEAYARANYLILRNPSIVNFLDGCALSVPCHAPGEAPVGLTIAGMSGADHTIMRVGQAIEAALGATRGV